MIRGELVALASVPMKWDGNTLPDRLLVLPEGSHATNKGTVNCSKRTADVLMANQREARRGQPKLDFNHNTLKGAPAYRGEPAEIAANSAGVELVPGEGVYLTGLEWTPQGERMVRERHYTELSAAVVRDRDGNVLLVESAAVCRHGEIEGLTILSADYGGTQEKTETKGNQMDKWRKLVIQLLARLGVNVAEGASDDDVGAAADGALAATEGLSADSRRIIERLDRIEARDADRERQAIVDAAGRDGKVIPLSADNVRAMPLPALRELVDKLPKGQVPADRQTPGSVTPLSSDAIAQGAEAEVRGRLKISEEAWNKWAPKAAAAILLGLCLLAPAGSGAAQATANFDAPQRLGEVVVLPMVSNATLYAGTIIAVSNGIAVAAQDLSGQTVVGRSEQWVDDDDGTSTIAVRRGVFRWNNSTSDPVGSSSLGAFCFVEDDTTVNAGGGSHTNRAGIVIALDSTNYVWVDTARVTHPTTSVGADAVTSANIADDAVSLEHLDSGITPARVPTLWTNVTITGDTTTNAVTITGVASTDAILVTAMANGQNMAVYEAKPTTDTVTLRTSLVPTNTTFAIGAFKAAQ